jgi:phasin family protein
MSQDNDDQVGGVSSNSQSENTKRAAKSAKSVNKDKVAQLSNYQVRALQPQQAMEILMTNKDQFSKLSSEAANVGKEGLEALVKSSSIMFGGYEQMFKTCLGLAQKSAEKNAEAFKTLMTCKSLNELAEAQNKLAQQNFDDFISGATQLSELSVKLAADSFAPINEQVTKTIQKTNDSLAA